jgi:hypothetical protein
MSGTQVKDFPASGRPNGRSTYLLSYHTGE